MDSMQLKSGETLKAQIVGAGGLNVTLLIIDDNGAVQDLARFTAIKDNALIVEVPIARSGPKRATRQLLIALGSTNRQTNLTANIGRTAQTFFSKIDEDTLKNFVFGMVSFNVQ